jgi:hypothetical protein
LSRVTFRSKVDWWLATVLLAAATASLIAVAMVAKLQSPLAALAVSPLLLLTVGLPMWVLWATCYGIDGSDLHIRSGPFAWRVPLRDIQAITPTRNPLSSPALSLDRLRLDVAGKRSIMVSPRDKQRFIAELRKRMPAAATSAVVHLR